jgi:hypothetical protein
MDITFNMDSFENKKVDNIQFQKMVLVFNALQDGWSVKKRDDAFIFTKSHEGRKEVLLETYLQKFLKSNLDISKCIM